MNNILIYTFFNFYKHSFHLLKDLQIDGVEKRYLSYKYPINFLLSDIKKNNYDLIIGIADFIKTSKRARVENKFINKKGKKTILAGGVDFFETSFRVKETERFYNSPSVTNGPCNRSGYLIMNTILKFKLDTKFTFVHVPKNFQVEELSRLTKIFIE